MTQIISQDTTAMQNWTADASAKEEITGTIYDEAYTPLETELNGDSALFQKNLRNRVSYTYVKATDDDDPDHPWDAATFYTYDIHGNVDTLLQDYKTGIGAVNCINSPDDPSGNRFKKMIYDYDLISGKVNAVAYQPGQADQFYHKYEYDAENRIIAVQTSKDKIYWERDAAYDYYRHGPLSRTILGQNQVQGVDYAYTVQGWLKGVNTLIAMPNSNTCPLGTAVDELIVNDRSQNGSPAVYEARTSITFEPEFESNTNDEFETSLDPEATICDITGETQAATDMGNDGSTGSIIAKDAYGFTLHYFDTADVHDYNPIGAAQPLTGITPAGFNFTSLYNGNIGAMSVNLPKAGKPLFYAYKYDQLNRISSMNAYKGLNPQTNAWEPVSIGDYKENVVYDPNGNILSYKRDGFAPTLKMDSLTYEYIANTNKLKKVTDNIGYTGNYPDDIDNQTDDENYVYDSIGNLIKDKAEGNTIIDWNVYGKIKSITKTGTSISYTYDASGNRISKIVNSKATYYVRDASGNIMSIYEKDDSLKQKEINLYGSSRLGVYNVDVDVQTCSATLPEITTFTRGNKFFELSNHLGNVLATLSDKKLQHQTSGDTIDYYNAEVLSANDYYPGGMQMPGRKYSIANTNYRYGFNGKENDNDVKGEGNQQDYGNRIYDTRLGRFLSVDPLQKKFPALSPYQFSGDNPVATIDLDGLEPVAINPGTETLILILQGFGVNPPDNNTQASNAAKTNANAGIDYGGLGMLTALGKDRPEIQVVVYASSTTENTKKDVLSTIKNFQSINPNGKVLLIGHSQGADNAIELLKENRDIKVDLLATFDTQEAKVYFDIKHVPIITGIDDNNVYSNVKYAINFYQTTEAVGGETLDFISNKTSGYNINAKGSNHRSIDNDVTPYLYFGLMEYIIGTKPLNDALTDTKTLVENRTFDPKGSNSENILPKSIDKDIEVLKSRSK